MLVDVDYFIKSTTLFFSLSKVCSRFIDCFVSNSSISFVAFDFNVSALFSELLDSLGLDDDFENLLFLRVDRFGADSTILMVLSS